MTDAAPFAPRLDILTPPQRRLWDELGEVPETFTLYGGTGLALHLGHRQSVDFDFFGTEEFDPRELKARVPFLADAEVVRQQEDTLEVRLDRGGPVLASFFGAQGLGRVREPMRAGGVAVAHPLDLAGTKVSVIQMRAKPRDYIDLAALLDSVVTLPEALAAGAALYGRGFNPLIAMKAVGFFEEPALAQLPSAVKNTLERAVQAARPLILPDLSPVAPSGDRSEAPPAGDLR